MFRKLTKIALAVATTLFASQASAQDLLANQAPVDRKMMTVDSIMLHRLVEAEEQGSPAADLYADWVNGVAHSSGRLPDSLRIDLRGFVMPTPSRVVTSNFGARWGRQHKGLDIKVYVGDTIRAAFSGKVRVVRYDARGYGKYVVIRHYNGLETYYGHLSAQLVREEQDVVAGQPIGLGGNTGRSTGSHLHFETRLCGEALNPALMFDFKEQDVVSDFYLFRRNTYQRESARATQLRGANGAHGYNPADVHSPNVGRSQASSAAAPRYHKVRKGETLSSIARKRGTTVAALCRANHIGKNVRLRPGQILRYN